MDVTEPACDEAVPACTGAPARLSVSSSLKQAARLAGRRGVPCAGPPGAHGEAAGALRLARRPGPPQ